MVTNFYVYVDADGKMPVLCRRKAAAGFHKPFWVRYVGGRPVEYHGPKDVLAQDVSGTKVWDYAAGRYVPMDGIRKV